MSLTLYYASDVHGSDVLWRKFVNAGRFYDADVLVMGGDIAGKAVVPIVQSSNGYRCEQVSSKEFAQDQLEDVQSKVRSQGFYPLVITNDELEELKSDDSNIARVFKETMASEFKRWLDLADERLGDTDIKLFVMLGNDDEPGLRDVITTSKVAIDPEDVAVDIGEGFQMVSCGWANPTPWKSPREMPDERLEAHLESLISEVEDPQQMILNLHVPPSNTAIDQAPRLDDNLKPVVDGGSLVMISAGSRAVRNVIERYQPPLALHGHIHESRGAVKIGRTVCINPGSEYAEGVLHGALVVLDRKKGLQRYQLTSG
ncbi:MAG: metallophosphoesterase [Actinomycetota bacterium]|nr:metallophosphoesterase [Actinomycetota bacterium]